MRELIESTKWPLHKIGALCHSVEAMVEANVDPRAELRNVLPLREYLLLRSLRRSNL